MLESPSEDELQIISGTFCVWTKRLRTHHGFVCFGTLNFACAEPQLVSQTFWRYKLFVWSHVQSESLIGIDLFNPTV